MKLTIEQIRQRQSDLRHLHTHAYWPNGEVPPWVYDVLRGHFAGQPYGHIGPSAVETVALREMVDSLLGIVDDDAQDDESRQCDPIEPEEAWWLDREK